MENNLEKQQFFAQYFGQHVFRHPTIKNGGSIQLKGRALEKGWLELKPLSAITDEDAKEVIRLSSINNDGHYDEFFKTIQQQKNFAEYFLSARPLFLNEAQNITDFLRSKSYALPWKNLSVEQLIEKGYIRLTETISK